MEGMRVFSWLLWTILGVAFVTVHPSHVENILGVGLPPRMQSWPPGWHETTEPNWDDPPSRNLHFPLLVGGVHRSHIFMCVEKAKDSLKPRCETGAVPWRSVGTMWWRCPRRWNNSRSLFGSSCACLELNSPTGHEIPTDLTKWLPPVLNNRCFRNWAVTPTRLRLILYARKC